MLERLISWLPRIPFRRQIGAIADKVRRRVSLVDDAEVRKARRLARVSRKGNVDVVYFGDSVTSFVATYDKDRRPLHHMIRDMLGDDARLYTVHGGSYGPVLYAQFLKLIAASDLRPVVIMPQSIRVRVVPCMDHPVHGRKNAIRFLSQLDPTVPLWKIRKGFPPPAADEWAAFHALPHPTWAGDWKIGDYLERLNAADEHDEERVKLLYAYLHGGRIPPGERVAELTRLAQDFRQLELPVVSYQTPVPVQKGEDYYPGFQALAAENFAVLHDAFVAGYGDQFDVLQTGMVGGTEEFIDYRDATEHVNELGRRRLAEAISTQVRLAIKSRSVRQV